MKEVACRRKATIGEFCVIHAKQKNPRKRSTLLDSIKKWAPTVGAAGTTVKILHEIAVTIGPHIHLAYSNGTKERIEFSTLIAKAESIQETANAKEPTEEALANAGLQLTELQNTVSAIVRQIAAASLFVVKDSVVASEGVKDSVVASEGVSALSKSEGAAAALRQSEGVAAATNTRTRSGSA